MSIPHVSFVPFSRDSNVDANQMPNGLGLDTLGFSKSQIADLCAMTTDIYRNVLSRNLPTSLLETAPKEIPLGGFEQVQQVGAAASLQHDSYGVRVRDGKKEIPLKEGTRMMLGITPADLHSAERMEKIRGYITHECIHLATRQAISSLMRGPEEAMVIALERSIHQSHDDLLTNKNYWNWARARSRSTDGYCPPDFEDIDLYNEASAGLYVAAANAFENESEADLWAFAGRLTEIAVAKNAAPVKAELEQAVRDSFPKTADSILKSPAFKEISKEGLQTYWVSNANQTAAVFFPQFQEKIPKGSSPVNPLSTFAIRPVIAQFRNTFYTKGKIPMGAGIKGGGDLTPLQVVTLESIREKMKKTGRTDAINLAHKIGGVSIQVPPAGETVNLYEG